MPTPRASRAPRRTSQDRKLDELLIALARQQDQLVQLSVGVAELKTTVGAQAKQIEAMEPTVKSVGEALTFARVGKASIGFFATVGFAVIGFIWWMDGRWSLLVQLFKRIP